MLLPLHLNGLNLDSGTVIATVSGTILTAGETDIQNGGRTIIIILTNDTWVAATFDAQRQNILNGLDSDGSELTGWNNEVRDSELVTAVVRTSDTVVTITLTAAPNYDITASETVTVEVPATALVTSASNLTATPTFGIAAEAEPTRNKGGLTKAQRRKRPRYLVEIDGQFFDAENISGVQAILGEAETLAMVSAAEDAKEAPESIRIKPPRVKVTTGSGSVTQSVTIQRDVRQTQERINRIYAKAQAHVDEIRRAVRERERKEDEDDVITSLLL